MFVCDHALMDVSVVYGMGGGGQASRRCEEEVKAWPLDIFGRYVRTW